MDLRFWVAVGAGLVLANLIDWLFAGVLFHQRYQTYPEVWRINGANPRALIGSQVMTLPTVFGLVGLMLWSGQTTFAGAVCLGGLVFVIAAAPPIIANGLFIKIDRMVVISHTVGWLVKLVVVAGAASLILNW
jgi:hypothetical protein